MVRHSFQSVLLIITLCSFVQGSPLISQKRGICATEDPDASFLDALQEVKDGEIQSNRSIITSEARNAPIEIETWFHILLILQDSYEDSGIKYQLQGVTRHVNDLWAKDGDDIAMKTALRKGTYRTLNVYFQTDLQASPGQSGRVSTFRGASTSSDLTSSVLGFCTLPDPSINGTSTRDSYVKDGCNILAKTMPGGSLDLYNRGGTAIHEIGHWNGLLHTFQGESCDASNPGDYISDTPQQSTPTDGCPARKDSCPDSPGLDAVHDFMDYSSDICYETFTAGQMKRMRNMWTTMRFGK
ncbi:Extracellular metalloprotease [Penicillium malachiteum]|uniref:Extracellular metalloprotease n=1 Tax=Penicillium malachiteum TaxID=1324776 RepID=UPI002549131A|nr:Extracellular metalloprotease [Penicillium malachiteum]KAJ5726500.1 Extracellular metalloprotease [Penicillium malachiteum]